MSSYARTRETGPGFASGLAVYTAYNGAGSTTKSNNYAQGSYSIMKDTVTKNFKKVQEAGQVVMNPMYRASTSKICEPKTYAHVYRNGYPSQWYVYSGYPWTSLTHGFTGDKNIVSAPGTFLMSYDEILSMETEVSTRVLSNIGRASTDTWENLAESKKTLSMMWNPLSSWFRFERKARAASLALSSANAWLMYRYGIRPLVGSVSDIMTAVEDGLKRERITTRSTVANTETSSSTYTHSYDGVLAHVQRTYSETIEVRAMSLDEMVTDWRYQYGFDAKSLLTLPWNLVSYSFVADWMFNVSDLIGAFGQAFYPASLGRCLVTTQIGSAVEDGATDGWVSGYTVQSPGRTLLREDTIRKERVVGIRSPGFVTKTNFRFDDLTRLADAVSLVGQQLLRRFKR